MKVAHVFAALLTLTGCGTTKLNDSWQSPDFHRASMEGVPGKVLVVAVTQNPTNQILFEEGFVSALLESGIAAVAGHKAIGPTTPTRENVTSYVERHGIRYVIASRYGGSEITKWAVPESVRTYYTGPYVPTYRGYWDHYGNSVTVTRGAYVDERMTVTLTTSIFDVQTGDLVWVGRSKSFDTSSISYGASDLADQVVHNIKR